jgi:hypothetical protein
MADQFCLFFVSSFSLFSLLLFVFVLFYIQYIISRGQPLVFLSKKGTRTLLNDGGTSLTTNQTMTKTTAARRVIFGVTKFANHPNRPAHV